MGCPQSVSKLGLFADFLEKLGSGLLTGNAERVSVLPLGSGEIYQQVVGPNPIADSALHLIFDTKGFRVLATSAGAKD